VKIEEAAERLSRLEQYEFCYCASREDFRAIQILVNYVKNEGKPETCAPVVARNRPAEDSPECGA